MDGLWDWQPFSLYWVNSGFICLKDMNADHLNSLVLFGSFVIFQWGEEPRMESPRSLQIFGKVLWCTQVWGMETPLVIDQVLAGLFRLVFAKTPWIQPIPTKQFANILCLPLLAYKWKTFQSWPFLFMNLLLANVQDDFKKKHSKPGFANDLGFSGPKFMLKINK